MRRPLSIVLALALGAGASVTTSVAVASAAPTSTVVAGVSYVVDPEAPASGATATGLADPASTLTLPPSITVDGATYDVVAVADRAFEAAGLTSVALGERLVAIGDAAFQSNALTTLDLPASLRTIGAQGFAFNAIESATIREGVATLDTLALYGNRLAELSLPSTITTLGSLALAGNPLETLTMLGPPPATLGTVADFPQPTLLHPWRYGAERYEGGYGSPEWNDMPTVAVATIAFDAAGGSATPSQQVPVDGASTATQPAPPTRAGFAFAGWTTDGASAFDFDAPVTGDATLVASWIAVPTITGPATASGTIGAAFAYVPTIGGDAPVALAVSGALPAGLAFDPSTGRIAGTPSGAPGASSVTITATNAGGSASLALVITLVAPASPPVATPPTATPPVTASPIATLPRTGGSPAWLALAIALAAIGAGALARRASRA